MADVEDLYDITYNQGESITVHMDDQDLVFHREGKMYVGDMSECVAHTQQRSEHSAHVTTVEDNESTLTARELKRVRTP